MILHQFSVYLTSVIAASEQVQNDYDRNVALRLQITAYSQFWECLAVQRLLLQLCQIAGGSIFDSTLLLGDRRPKVPQVFESIVALASRSNLKIESLVGATYWPQIRNAISHSELWLAPEVGWITFENYDASKRRHIPSIQTSTWDSLFKVTTDFISHLFRVRRELEARLDGLAPYRIDLPEFRGPFVLSRDHRGYWQAKPCD